MFDVVSGIEPATTGEVWLAGRRATNGPPESVARLGMARCFASVRLFPDMTAREHLLLARQARLPLATLLLGPLLPAAHRRTREDREAADEILLHLGIDGVADMRPGEMTVSQQRRLDLATALATRPRLLLLDESAAGLPRQEVMELARYIRLLGDCGLAVVLVEHNMEFVWAAADEVLVLDYGEVIATGKPDEIKRDARVIRAYLGAASESAAS